MTNSVSSPTTCDEILKRLVITAFDKAKWWSMTTIAIQASIFLVGLVAIFVPKITTSYPWVGLPLAVVGAWVATKGSGYKSVAEQLKRQQELSDGFGRKLSAAQLSDIKHQLGNDLPEDKHLVLKQGVTYASASEKGPKRVLENLIESAWFSKHLSAVCVKILTTVTVLALISSISALFWSLENISATTDAIGASRFIASTLIFALSVGLVRSLRGYQSFHDKCVTIESQAQNQMASDDNFEALRILAEYQLARAGAPMIPTWVWKLRKDQLNEDWKVHSLES